MSDDEENKTMQATDPSSPGEEPSKPGFIRTLFNSLGVFLDRKLHEFAQVHEDDKEHHDNPDP